MYDYNFMQRTFVLAKEGMARGDGGPFGAVVVRISGGVSEIVSEANNIVLTTNDPTAHAEIVAIRRATEKLGRFDLSDCVIYTSCEPCPMCFGAIYWARPRAVYYANTKDDAASIGFDDEFIYQELGKSISDRSILFKKVDEDGAIEAFELWRSKTDKIGY